MTEVDDEAYQDLPYEIKIVEYLLDQLGSNEASGFEALFLAMYSRKGLTILDKEMNKVFGRQSLSKLFVFMGEKYHTKMLNGAGK